MDLLIRNGIIVDGTGNPWRKGDVAIDEGRIVAVGRLADASASRVIDATGLVVCPGFVDQHSHADWTLTMDPFGDNMLRQGVATMIVGNCGWSAAPLTDQGEAYYRSSIVYPDSLRDEVSLPWRSMAEYLAKLEETGLSHNIGTHVGHSTLRAAAMRNPEGVPDEEELESMKKMADLAMSQGAFGLSTGLNFPPGSSSTTEELVELAGVVAARRGIYATHHRSYAGKEKEAIDEALEVGRRAGITVHFPHYAASFTSNLTQDELLATAESARGSGMDVTFDWCRAYSLAIVDYDDLLKQWIESPHWLIDGSVPIHERLKEKEAYEEARSLLRSKPKLVSFENLYLLTSEAHPEFRVKTFEEISRTMGVDPYDVMLRLVVDEGPGWTSMGTGNRPYTEEDNQRLLAHPLCMVEADQPTFRREGVLARHMRLFGNPKPFGTFPRTLRLYVREKKLLSLEEAIRKMTSFPAQTVGLGERGVLREGNWADLLVFDLERFRDRATYEEPHHYAEGVEYLIVNGEIEVERDKLTYSLAGKILRR